MLDILQAYWWAALGLAAVYFFAKFWIQRRFGLLVNNVLAETQSGFAAGNVEVHSLKAVRTLRVQDETAILYHIDATITPAQAEVAWCGADLFLRGVDGDPNQVGDVLTIKQWNGASFEAIKNQTQFVGTQRLLLSVRFAGTPGPVRFNWNFANFGPTIELPELTTPEPQVATSAS